MTFRDIFDRACSDEHRPDFLYELRKQLRDNEADLLRSNFKYGAPGAKARADKLKLIHSCLLTEGEISPLYRDCGAFVVALNAAGKVLGIDRPALHAAASEWDTEFGIDREEG